jgi:glycosyltransferase involved in cell wall biosynthesis
MNPLGGTELQMQFLKKHVDNELLKEVQITSSVPENIPLSKDKINILWQQNSYNQTNLFSWFKDKSNHSKYDWYVFNSHWCYEKYRMMFDIATDRSLVIKNGITKITPRNLNYKKGNPIKLIFHPTPWRGLNVILAAMKMIQNPLIALDVYSSTEVYGDQFKAMNDKKYQGLYDQAKQLPNVNYIGYKPNSYILEHLQNYHIFAFPSIWEETSCISAIEAMSAGLHCIVTNYGALFETCAEYATYLPYQKSYENLAKRFAYAIEKAASNLSDPAVQEHLQIQIDYTNRFYNWERIGSLWTNFLKAAINARHK